MKIITTALLATSILFLTGCSVEVDSGNSSFLKKVIKKETLSNGQVVLFTQGDVKPAWRCKSIGKDNVNWTKARLEGNFNISGPRGVVLDEAKTFITKNHLSKANLVHTFIPTTTSVGNIQVSGDKYAVNTIYDCAHPPAEHDSPF